MGASNATVGSSRRTGFSLVEVLVALGIIALLVAVVLPMVVRRIPDGQSSAIAKTLAGLREAVYEYRTDVRRYPTHLRYLSAAPGSATDICGQSVPASFLASWKGPYVDRSIGTTGLVVDEMTVLDSIVRTPTTFTATTTGEIALRVSGVDSAVARRVEAQQDVTADFAAGTIRWTNVANGVGIMQLVIPVRGC